MDEITWVSVTDILQRVTGSCDYGTVEEYDYCDMDFWQTMLSEKCSDTGFGHLVDSIMTHGFSEQGHISIEENYDGGWYITEGHHRLCAAILLCMDKIPVSDKYSYWIPPGMEGTLSAHYNEDAHPISV